MESAEGDLCPAVDAYGLMMMSALVSYVRKMAYFGHVVRGDRYNILQLIMMGKIEGRRGIGRKQASWLKNIREWTGIKKAEHLFRIARDRDSFAMLIANVKGT
ncbi:uncharacterized protein LOC126888064 [Diabrotica virgifera virgifera]|uniref:Uncharacterized protein n=1 Tax=Diabrotica virgifera virgifera TaxID=50390 RepID=A0ABM5KPB6_DIAVI|nr:uncharacterized protein LOC126888064 [Diabrotica virgifera virgifera]